MLFVGGVCAYLLVHNAALNLLPFPQALYVPVNLAMAAVLVALARWAGIGTGELGFSSQAVGPGLRWGGAIAVAVAAGLAVALVVPQASRFLADERVVGIGAGALAYRTLVRIPLGTAAAEEIAFRGVLYGALARERGVLWGIVGSSVVFGLWHIGPAVELLRANRFASGAVVGTLLVVGAVVGTAAGGVALALLRRATGGLVGPFLVHLAANDLATLAAVIHQGRGGGA